MGLERTVARSRLLGQLHRRWTGRLPGALTRSRLCQAAVGISLLLLLWGCDRSVPGEPPLGNYSDAGGTGPLVELERLTAALALPADSGNTTQPGYQPELPAVVGGKMLTAAVQEQSVPLEQLTITASRPRQWRDSCLGIVSVDQLCAQVITPGWQGIVSDSSQDWVYHSDELGEVVELNSNASETSTRIQLGPLAQVGQLDGGILSLRVSSFIAVEEAPITSAQALLIDGSFVDLDETGAVAESSRREVSIGQIQAFDQQRNQAQLAQFDGLRYGVLTPTADQFWVSLVDSQGIVQYDPAVQVQLPPELQALSLAWEAIACAGPLGDCASAPNAPSAN